MAVTKPKAPGDKKKPFDEFESVVRWRFQALVALGLQPDQAMSLVEKPDVAHAAQKLVEQGCPPELVVQLLSGD